MSSNQNAEPDDFDIAVAHHQAGRLSQAKALYHSILEAEPEALDIRYFLAMIAHQEGDNGLATSYLDPVIRSDPDYPEALYLAGMIAYQQQRCEAASELIAKALSFQPDDGNAHYNLGNVLVPQGRLQEAVSSYQRAIALKPDFSEAHFQLANTLVALNKVDEAITSYNLAVALTPDNAEAHFKLGNALIILEQTEEAIASYRRVLAQQPDNAETLNNLGNALLTQGHVSEALDHFERALRLLPKDVEILFNQANALKSLLRFEEAIAAYRQALEVNPLQTAIQLNLGAALFDSCQFEEAINSFRSVVDLEPHNAIAHNDLGMTLMYHGMLDDAAASCCKAVALKPDFSGAYSNYLMIRHYQPNYSPAEILDEHLAYANQFEAPLRETWPQFNGRSVSGRKLKIGFVSGDLHQHPVGIFLQSTLANFDRRIADIFIYSTSPKNDRVSDQLKSMDVTWHSLVNISDSVAAENINAEGIDILVDMSGHTGHNRLPLFARKPAPIQVTWLGYWATTGLQAMDYILCAPHEIPPAEARWFVEQPWYLPDTRLCFTAPEHPISISALPAASTGKITFGCFNNLVKMNDIVVALWARVLHGVPGSRLYLKALQLKETGSRQSTIKRFAAHSIAADRLLLEGPSSHQEYLSAYHKVDISLDPFPFTGGTTSFESLWMGVPFITLRGTKMIARQGEGILSNIGLSGLVANDENDYVMKAVTLAADLPRLSQLRSQLRARLAASPLCDGARFARNLETAFNGMWQKYCRENQ